MKKFFVILLALMLAFSMCACEELEQLKSIDLPDPPDTSAAPETEASPEPDVEVTDGEPDAQEAGSQAEPLSNPVMVSIGSTSYQEFDPAEGKELILTFAYETPSVYIEGRDEAASAINNYIAVLDETYYTGNDYGAGTAMGYNMMYELALDNYGYIVGTGAEDMPYELVSSRSVTVVRSDSQVLSILYDDYVNLGGAHGEYVNTAYVFDTVTGNVVTLDSITTDFDALRSFLVQYMVEAIEADENQYYSQRIDAGTVPPEQYSAACEALLREGSWYLGQDGLVIFSDLYEFGAYAAGTIKFTVPYADLEGKLEAKWIPAQREGTGQFSVKPIADVEDGSVQIIDRVVANSEGQELCLIVEGTVYDVKVSSGDYTDRFYETAQLWSCSYMQNSAVQLVTVVPDGMPELMLSYRTAGGEQHRLFISQGEDGSLALVDDSIEAVG